MDVLIAFAGGVFTGVVLTVVVAAVLLYLIDRQIDKDEDLRRFK